MKKAFTLAEVLITLSIIGVVAALTIPSLIVKYQKHVLYNQFMKAVSVLENAVRMFEVENDCVGSISNILEDGEALNTKHLIKYFNVAQEINNDNYENICKNSYDAIEEDNPCINDRSLDGTYAFITNDGMLFNFSMGVGWFGYNEGIVDVNGPNKGPNKYGKDIFVFYEPCRISGGNAFINKLGWGGNEKSLGQIGNLSCNESDKLGCAAKLLHEGKMNY